MTTKAVDLDARQEFTFKVGEEPIKLELRRGLAEVYGTELLANRSYTFCRGAKASVFTYHGATIEMTGTPLKSRISKNCDYMTCYLRIHRDLERMRSEAESLSEQMKFTTDKPVEAAPGTDADLANQPGTQQPAVAGDQSDPTIPVTIGFGQGSDRITVEPALRAPDLSKTPICLITEPLDIRNVGKSSLCRILLNYAARRGRAPIFVDLDPDQGHVGLPGSIGALSIESPIDIETGLQLRSSMLLHFGLTSPSADTEGKKVLYYKPILDNMAKIVHSKLEQDRKSYYSGVIINTSSWSGDKDYAILVDACKAFKTNLVLVVDDEVLQEELQKHLADEPTPVQVINVPKTLEIYKPSEEEKVKARYSRFREYFYGTEIESFNPMTSEMKFSYLKRLIYRITNPPMLSESLMPLGRKQQEVQVKVSRYECTAFDLLHRILAVSYARIDDVIEDPKCVLNANIMGFINITSVRSDGETVSILTPQKLPNPLDHVLLYSVQYMDS